MLDIRFIREFRELVEKNIKERRLNICLDKLLELDMTRRQLIMKLEKLLSRRRENAKRMKEKLNAQEKEALFNEGRELKILINQEEERVREVENAFSLLLLSVPNLRHPDAPACEKENVYREIRRVGEPRRFSFPIRNHVELGEALDILNFEKASQVTAAKFYYLKNKGALLDMALQQYAIDFLCKRGFDLYITPDLAKFEVVEALGFNPRGQESNIYRLEDSGLCLIGTSEITLGGYYKDSVLDLSDKPIFMAGVSHCFRREAGAAGQFSRGLYRVHQFTKVEMFVICRPEQSEVLHEKILALEEEFFTSLELPYRVIDVGSQDLGASAYRKFDIEAWMPGRGEKGEYGEVTSASNCTDYQARRLKVRYKDEQNLRYVHMLNGTLVATSRAIVALLENGQQEDGSVLLPKVLVPYMGFDKIEAP